MTAILYNISPKQVLTLIICSIHLLISINGLTLTTYRKELTYIDLSDIPECEFKIKEDLSECEAKYYIEFTKIYGNHELYKSLDNEETDFYEWILMKLKSCYLLAALKITECGANVARRFQNSMIEVTSDEVIIEPEIDVNSKEKCDNENTMTYKFLKLLEFITILLKFVSLFYEMLSQSIMYLIEMMLNAINNL